MKETTLKECDVAMVVNPTLTASGNEVVSLHFRSLSADYLTQSPRQWR